MSDTTLTITEALKDELKRIKREHDEVFSLKEALLFILDNPDATEDDLDGQENRVSEPIKVDELTLQTVQKLKEEDARATNYEDAIRHKADINPRDVGEQPVEITDL